jgi:IS4 transposase
LWRIASKFQSSSFYHRFADDIVITLSGHHTKRGWAERVQQRLQEQLTPLGVKLNQEKTKVVDTLKGETFGFLGFDLRRVRKRKGNGHYLFKALKQNLRIKTFVGTSPNALNTQIWTALIALLLLKYLQRRSRFGWSLSNLAALLRQQLFIYRDLFAWLDAPLQPPPWLDPAAE